MPVDTRIDIPFIPQTSITHEILAAMQLANEHAQQRGQLGIQQQQLEQQAPLVQAQTGQAEATTAATQAGTAAGLPAAEAAFKKAASEHEQLQTQYEKETNPINKSLLEQNVREKKIDLDKKELLLKLMTVSGGSSMFDKQIDAIVPAVGPDGKPTANADLNQRTKVMAHSALQIGDLEGARKAVNSASAYLDEMNKTEYTQNREDVRQSLNRAAMFANEKQKNALDSVNKMFNDSQRGYQSYLAQATAARDLISRAKDGNELASDLTPFMTAMGLASFAGIKRIPPVLIAASGKDVGSLYRRLNETLDKATTGKMTADTLKETGEIIDGLLDAKHKALVGSAQMELRNAYGEKYDPSSILVLDRNGNPTPLEDVAPAGKAPKGKAPASAVAAEADAYMKSIGGPQ